MSTLTLRDGNNAVGMCSVRVNDALDASGGARSRNPNSTVPITVRKKRRRLMSTSLTRSPTQDIGRRTSASDHTHLLRIDTGSAGCGCATGEVYCPVDVCSITLAAWSRASPWVKRTSATRNVIPGSFVRFISGPSGLAVESTTRLRHVWVRGIIGTARATCTKSRDAGSEYRGVHLDINRVRSQSSGSGSNSVKNQLRNTSCCSIRL